MSNYDLIDNNLVPQHIGIIMDGNGRWAKLKKRPVSFGHSKGIERIEDIIAVAKKLKISTITIYAFSTENWKRDEAEIKYLFNLINVFYKKQIKKIIKNEVGIKIIGDIDPLPNSVKKTLEKIDKETNMFTDFTLNIALNYGGRQEIVSSINEFINNNPDQLITEDDITNFLPKSNSDNLDLLIRTSGEQRLSNFMLWQNAYSEMVFTNVLWPDFTEEEFLKCIIEYQQRDRRYGGRNE